MKNVIEMMEDLFKLDSHSEGTRVDICSIRCGMEVRLSVGNCRSQFIITFGDDYIEEFNHMYARSLRSLKYLLTNN